MTPRPLVLASFLVFAAAGKCRAETSDPASFEIRPPATSAALGTPFEISGTARYSDKLSLSINLEAQATSAFTITRIDFGTTRRENGMAVQDVKITTIPFDLGPQIFPPLVWSLTGANTAAQTLRSPPVKIAVAIPPAASDNSPDIRDIKAPMEPLLWPYFLLLTVLIGGTVYLGRRYWPGTRETAAAEQLIDPRPPHEIALEQLRGLDSLNLNEKQYYDRMSEILRIYLERRFDVPAMVLTTTDLIRQMRQAEIDRAVITTTKEIVDRADLVKFAKFLPTKQEMGQDRDSAIEVVQATAPKPEPVTPSQTPAPSQN